MQEFRRLFDLDGRKAVVIGAGSGIGQASALGLAAFGARVYCADLDLERASSTAASIREGGGEAEPVALDIRDGGEVAAALELSGAPDVLVVTPSVNVRKPMLEISDSEFERVVDLNLKGVFRVMREFGRAMAARRGGSIILFSSIRSQVVEPGQGVYAATKAGTVQLARTLAAELGKKGVRVNAIAPGVVETPLTAQIQQSPDWYRAYADKSALGRWAKPSEMVGAVLFLASDAGSYVTGSCLMVDGGWTAVDGRFSPPL
ncbi:MAG: 3-oxoacyl-ACP reductase [Candidatus Nephthysia bennettiae]|uniref:SDR family oxidoreductase n=1 Tax=Candidatus Nephthysia bennettiae TaxID=3127016 RepID=A0A934KAL4_9BACT|nr:SDR family oxidoreductase [Candidatus Dormibacteraeota bacterium]MBJ7612637.1 SDR family oxidoreductase [Candidatus Dormibacteraeota bacterium]PZR97416.1 MAG: 3-oxoacyl-ACP reductase [Candidatus Dormibacteraeota bacterium]